MTPPINLNHYLSEEIRIAIEQRYYARINEQASLEIACLNPEFMRNMRATLPYRQQRIGPAG